MRREIGRKENKYLSSGRGERNFFPGDGQVKINNNFFPPAIAFLKAHKAHGMKQITNVTK
jgi:hypothetical protein